MPMYEFYCDQCKKTKEELFKLSARPGEIDCECGAKAHYVVSGGRWDIQGASALNNYSGDSNYAWHGIKGSE